jgi:hypothetical protein
MRRYNKDKQDAHAPRHHRPTSGSVIISSADCADDTDLVSSVVGNNEVDAAEIQAILEEEGVIAEEEGKAADELEKLTGTSLF